MQVDQNIVDAVVAWMSHGIEPGSCTTLLLQGKYDEAKLHAHPLILPYWQDHIKYIESLPVECRGENMKEWQERCRGIRK